MVAGLSLLIVFLISLFNGVYMVNQCGMSFGKFLLNIKIVDSKNRKLPVARAFKRFIVRSLILMFGRFGLAAYWFFMDEEGRAPSDHAARSYVVRGNKK